jgi:L-ascorbate metabolism protein UlaG (beta-lactamase superfamily)
VSVTWWGHATTTITLGGRRILTDPVLTRHVAHLSRVLGPLPSLAARQADVVAVSHLHFDHLHVPSLRQLGTEVRIVGPKGTARVLARATPLVSHRVEEVVPGDVVDIDGVRLRVVPAAHDGRRTPLARSGGPALGFILEATGDDQELRVWFAGDTGLFDAMDQLGPVDVAVIPIGGWGPTLGPTHLDPIQAAEAIRRVGARDAVPIHYGTFWPTGLRHVRPSTFRHHFIDPAPRFAAALQAGAPGSTAHVIGVGETATIPEP